MDRTITVQILPVHIYCSNLMIFIGRIIVNSSVCIAAGSVDSDLILPFVQLTNLKMVPSVPDLSIDMLNAILSVPAIEFGKLGDKALLIESQFRDEEMDVCGYFILIPTMESYAHILNSLGM